MKTATSVRYTLKHKIKGLTFVNKEYDPRFHPDVRKANKYMMRQGYAGRFTDHGGKPFLISVKAVKKLMKRRHTLNRIRISNENHVIRQIGDK